MRPERVTDALAEHGEGPVWDARSRRLLWVDMLRGDLLATSLEGDTDRTHVADVAACVVPRARGGLAVATERGFTLLEADGSSRPLPDVWDDTSVRMNDGGVDPLGRFWCGSMAYDAAAGRGELFRLDPDLTVSTVLAGVTISNGLSWTPDGAGAYYVDSTTRKIDLCSPDLSRRQTFAVIPDDLGLPDGLTVDAEGGVWVALWGGSGVHRYLPDGTLEAKVDLPVAQVTSCAFGGDDLATLFITTSAQGLPDPEPEAGSLFAVRPGVAGLPAQEFQG